MRKGVTQCLIFIMEMQSGSKGSIKACSDRTQLGIFSGPQEKPKLKIALDFQNKST